MQHAIERVGRPGGSHEGVGRKKTFGSSSGPFGSSFRLVGSYTPFGVYKDTTMGAGCGSVDLECGVLISSTSYSGFWPNLVQLIAWAEDTYIGLALRSFIVSLTLSSLFSPSDENIQLETLGEEFELAGNIWWGEHIKLWVWDNKMHWHCEDNGHIWASYLSENLRWDVSVLWGQYLHHRHRDLQIIHLIFGYVCCRTLRWLCLSPLRTTSLFFRRFWSSLTRTTLSLRDFALHCGLAITVVERLQRYNCISMFQSKLGSLPTCAPQSRLNCKWTNSLGTAAGTAVQPLPLLCLLVRVEQPPVLSQVKGALQGDCESEPQLAATSHAAVVWCSAFLNHLPRNQTAELSCQDEHCLLQRPTPGPKFSIARRQTVSFELSNVSAPWLHRKSYKDAPAEWSWEGVQTSISRKSGH